MQRKILGNMDCGCFGSVEHGHNVFHYLGYSGVVSTNLGRAKKFWGGKMPDFRRITLFFMEKRLSKHKMTIFSKNLGGHCPSAPPGYAYAKVGGHCPSAPPGYAYAMLLGLMVSFYHQQSKRIRRYQILA